MHRDDVSDDVDEDATLNLQLRRMTSCMHHCQPTRFHSFCLARCLAKTTTARRHPVDAESPAVSAESPWPTGAFWPRSTDCGRRLAEQTDPMCDLIRQSQINSEDPPQAAEEVEDWSTSSEVLRPASKRGYNDVVDLCIAYNCPNAVPNSLEFLKCIRHFHCM